MINQPSAESGATAVVEEEGDGSSSSPPDGGNAMSEVAVESYRPKQEPRFLLADASSRGGFTQYSCRGSVPAPRKDCGARALLLKWLMKWLNGLIRLMANSIGQGWFI